MSETTPLRGGRIAVSGEVYLLDGKEVVLMGGNYVLKQQPYYPPLEVVRSNAKSMAQGAKSMAYTPPAAADGSARPVIPCVRLGAMMEAAFPSRSTAIDADFKAKLEATVQAFREEGVHVFLDMHQDAGFCSNGGEGYPWWVAADFQQRAGCCLEQCCCCCCFSSSCWSCCPESCRTPYVANSSHALQPFCGLPNCLAKCLNLDITTWAGDPEPWQPYSVGGDGNPGFFNVGNASARTNNSDDRWSALITTAQVQNCAPRIYNSGRNKADREVFFEPYLTLAKYLCTVWDRYENVIALELMNEPLLGGLPNLCTCLSTWRQILTFQGDVLEALDEDPSIKCPIVIDNWSSTVEGESCAVKLLSCIGASSSTMKRFQSYAERNRLILSFHYYSPPANVSFEELIALAKKNATKLGGAPVFLSEYWEDTAQKMADRLAMACDLGVNATTYWQYADTAWTEQPGWYKYPPSVTNAGTGVPVNAKGVIDDQAWAAFSKTVADGTFFSASITGASGAQMEVLQLVPANETASASASAAAAPAPAVGALGASGPGRGWRRGAEKELLPWPKDRPTCLHKPKRCLLPGESPAA